MSDVKTPANEPSALTEAEGALPAYARKLRDQLLTAFGGTVSVERTGTGRRCGFTILSEAFSGIDHSERQERIWKVVDETLTKRESLEISVIVAFAPDDE